MRTTNRQFFASAVFFAAFTFANPVFAATNAGTWLVQFDRTHTESKIQLNALNASLPADWSPYEFLVLEFKASSSQRFELGK